MSQEFNTLELARIYERQGYFQDAFEMYQALAAEKEPTDDSKMDPDIISGLHRMESALQNQAAPPKDDPKDELEDAPQNDPESLKGPTPENRIECLLEQWLVILVLEKRLKLFKQVKSRF